MSDDAKELMLTIDLGEDAQDAELDDAVRQLLNEVREVQSASANRAPAGPPPPGSRSPEAFTLGALTLSILPVYGPALLDFLTGWLARRRDDSVTIKVKSGDKELDLTYNPQIHSMENMEDLARRFSALLEDVPG